MTGIYGRFRCQPIFFLTRKKAGDGTIPTPAFFISVRYASGALKVPLFLFGVAGTQLDAHGRMLDFEDAP